MRYLPALLCSVVLSASATLASAADARPHILQQPTISKDLIAFSYAGDIWTVKRSGGHATRLTTGVGLESLPAFSPDGGTIAFTAEYDGNMDVYTIPVSGGIPKRVTYHPSPDYVVGWTPDGRSIIFRSTRNSASRYTQLLTVPVSGGVAKPMPLPMAYYGALTPDASRIAYNPLGPGSNFAFTSYVSWGHYHGGLAPSLRVTTLPGLDSVEVPHETSQTFRRRGSKVSSTFFPDARARSHSSATTRTVKVLPRCSRQVGRTSIHCRATATPWCSTGLERSTRSRPVPHQREWT